LTWVNDLPSSLRFSRRNVLQEKMMTDGNIAYLALVCGSFLAFGITLAYYMFRVPGGD